MLMENLIRQRVKRAIGEQVFPGCVIGVIKKEKEIIIPVGNFNYEKDSTAIKTDSIFDIASITKSIPTNSLALKLIDEGRLSTEDKLIDFLPEYNSQYREDVKIKHLLTYSIVLDISAPLSSHINDNPDEILKLIINAPLQAVPGTKFLYTNTPDILLGLVIEKIYGKRLDVVADEVFFKPLEMLSTTFHPEILDKELIVPTEICATRGLVQGFVHDEVTWALQKKYIPGCSGVFSTAGDLLKFAKMLMTSNEYFSKEIIKQMHTNQLGDIGISYGLGWELNQPRFMGKNVDKNTFGKTGFTGTMILINVEQQTAMVLLSNYTYPKRKPDALAINQVRADVADIVFSIK